MYTEAVIDTGNYNTILATRFAGLGLPEILSLPLRGQWPCIIFHTKYKPFQNLYGNNKFCGSFAWAGTLGDFLLWFYDFIYLLFI